MVTSTITLPNTIYRDETSHRLWVIILVIYIVKYISHTPRCVVKILVKLIKVSVFHLPERAITFGLCFRIFSLCPGDKCASRTNEDCWKHNFNGYSDLHTSAHFRSTQQGNSSWLTEFHLVSENLCKRKTKSLSGWKLECTSSEKLTIRWETRTKTGSYAHCLFHDVFTTNTEARAHSMLYVF